MIVLYAPNSAERFDDFFNDLKNDKPLLLEEEIKQNPVSPTKYGLTGYKTR